MAILLKVHDWKIIPSVYHSTTLITLGEGIAALFLRILPLCILPKTKEITYMKFVTDTVTDINSSRICMGQFWLHYNLFGHNVLLRLTALQYRIQHRYHIFFFCRLLHTISPALATSVLRLNDMNTSICNGN